MGEVLLSDIDGKILWQGRNTLTDAFENRLIGSYDRFSTPPLYCAVGASYATELRDDPWEVKQLESEMERMRILGGFTDPITARASLLSLYRSPNINTTWRELGLFDAPAKVMHGERSVTSCDSLMTGTPALAWSTGSGNTLILNPAKAVQGRAAITGICPYSGGDDLLFRNQGLFLNPSGFDEGRCRLQLHLGLSRPDAFVTLEIRLYNLPAGDGYPYQRWQIASGDLTEGYNFLDLELTDATGVNTPNFAWFQSIDILVVSRNASFEATLGEVRLFEPSGTMFARAELYPKFVKDGGTVAISWMIEPFLEVR